MTSTLLSRRERQVLELIADGLSNQAIADRLGTGLATVKTQVAHLNAKLGATNSKHAVAIGFRTGLLKVEVRS
jgi:DNA-binding CsgD family transcriptional regulator